MFSIPFLIYMDVTEVKVRQIKKLWESIDHQFGMVCWICTWKILGFCPDSFSNQKSHREPHFDD